METINVKFDELTTMSSEYSYLEPETNRFKVDDSSVESKSNTCLLILLHKKTLNNEDTPSSSSIIVEDNEARPLVSSSEEQPSPISTDVADEFLQEDFADLDGNTLITLFNPPMFEESESSLTNQDPSNMYEFNQVHPSIHTWKKSHLLEQVIGDPSKLIMTRSRLNTDAEVCMCAGISAKEEAPVNFLTDPLDGRSTLTPADILIFGWVGGKHACVDLTGVSSLVGLSSRGFTVGHTALKAASCKVTKHEKACIENQHMFVLFAFDTFGFLALKAVELLNRVQQVMHSFPDFGRVMVQNCGRTKQFPQLP
ncbi:hypothetical protein Tco_0602975 [Tanacetum coccineum]